MSDPVASRATRSGGETPRARDIAGWQRRFYAGPCVWATFYIDPDLGTEELGDLYESEEAARCAQEFDKRRHPTRPRKWARIQRVHIHTLALAQERWNEPANALREANTESTNTTRGEAP